MIQQTQGDAALYRFREQVLHGLELLQAEVDAAGSEVNWFRQTLREKETVGVFYDRMTHRLEHRQQEGIPDLLVSGRYIMLTKLNRWHASHLYTPFDEPGTPVKHSRVLDQNSLAALHRDWLEVLYVKAKEDVIAALVMSCVIPADVAHGLGLDLGAAVTPLVNVQNPNMKNAYVNAFTHSYSRDYLNLASEVITSALAPLLEDGADLRAVEYDLDDAYGLHIAIKLRRVIRWLQDQGVAVANGNRLVYLIDQL